MDNDTRRVWEWMFKGLAGICVTAALGLSGWVADQLAENQRNTEAVAEKVQGVANRVTSIEASRFTRESGDEIKDLVQGVKVELAALPGKIPALLDDKFAAMRAELDRMSTKVEMLERRMSQLEAQRRP